MVAAKHILIIILLAGGLACSHDADVQHKPAPKATPVTIWKVALTDVEERIESVATLAAYESVTLTARLSGKVVAIHFEDNDQVEVGQLLVELEDSNTAARVKEVEATLREAELQLHRLDRLGSDISTLAAIDIAKAKVAVTQALLAQEKATLEEHKLRAPFSGRLGFRRVSVGTLITPGTVVAELDDISQLKLDFTLPEVYLSRLGEGDLVVGQSPAWPNEHFEARVRTIASRVDPATGAVTVRAVMENKQGKLRPGMLLTVVQVIGMEKAILLPEEALIQKGHESFVYCVDENNQAYLVPVGIVRRVTGGVVISDGLESGQTVVVRGNMNLRPGSMVRKVGILGKDEQTEAAMK